MTKKKIFTITMIISTMVEDTEKTVKKDILDAMYNYMGFKVKDIDVKEIVDKDN